MLVKNIMSEPVVCCTPWDSVRYAVALIALHSVAALPVVSDLNDSLLEGIVTDRDLCCRVLAASSAIRIFMLVPSLMSIAHFRAHHS
jgi:CBS domain-containing protein